MGKFEVHLQDGFKGDEVIAKAGDREVYHGREVKTHPMLGLAAQFEFERRDGPDSLTLSVPNRGLTRTINLAADAPGYLGISIQGNKIITRPSARRFAYA